MVDICVFSAVVGGEVTPEDKQALRQRLEGWVEDGLMLRDGDWFLSLAVPADDAAGRISDSWAIRRALAGAIAELGDAARRKRASD